MIQSVSSFKSQQFLKLRAQWNKKLEDEGFSDIESNRERLKEYDRRTLTFDTKEMVFEFFYRLDHFLTEHENDPHIPELHKKILSFYSQGRQIIEIAKEVGLSDRTLRRILAPYKKLIAHQIVSGSPQSSSNNVFIIEIRNDALKLDN